MDTPVELRLVFAYTRRNGDPSEGIAFTSLTATKTKDGMVSFTITYEAQQSFTVYAFNPYRDTDGIDFTSRPGTALPGKGSISFKISESTLEKMRGITVNFYNDSGGTPGDNTNWLFITEEIIDRICGRT